MGVSALREPDHRCPLPSFGKHGQVVRCDECGSRWRWREFGNPAYSGWRRLAYLEWVLLWAWR